MTSSNNVNFKSKSESYFHLGEEHGNFKDCSFVLLWLDVLSSITGEMSCFPSKEKLKRSEGRFFKKVRDLLVVWGTIFDLILPFVMKKLMV